MGNSHRPLNQLPDPDVESSLPTNPPEPSEKNLTESVLKIPNPIDKPIENFFSPPPTSINSISSLVLKLIKDYKFSPEPTEKPGLPDSTPLPKELLNTMLWDVDSLNG